MMSCQEKTLAPAQVDPRKGAREHRSYNFINDLGSRIFSGIQLTPPYSRKGGSEFSEDERGGLFGDRLLDFGDHGPGDDDLEGRIVAVPLRRGCRL